MVGRNMNQQKDCQFVQRTMTTNTGNWGGTRLTLLENGIKGKTGKTGTTLGYAERKAKDRKYYDLLKVSTNATEAEREVQCAIHIREWIAAYNKSMPRIFVHGRKSLAKAQWQEVSDKDAEQMIRQAREMEKRQKLPCNAKRAISSHTKKISK